MPKTLPQRPLLLTVGATLTAIVAGLWTVFFATAMFGFGSGALDGREVSPQEFFVRAGAMLMSLGVLGLMLAFGLWRHRIWARPLAIATCGLAPIILALPDHESRRGLGSAIIAGALAAGLASLYFYGAPRVRAYYAQLIIGRASDLRPNGR
jgi:hypothetical protein